MSAQPALRTAVEESGPRVVTPEEERELFGVPAPADYESEDMKYIRSTGLLPTDPEKCGFEVKDGRLVAWVMNPETGSPARDRAWKKIPSFTGIASRLMLNQVYRNRFICIRDARIQGGFTNHNVLVLQKGVQAPVHPPTQECAELECHLCGVRDCPQGEYLHYHHDGCPAGCGAMPAAKGAATSSTPDDAAAREAAARKAKVTDDYVVDCCAKADTVVVPCSRMQVCFTYPVAAPVTVTFQARDPLRGFTGRELKECVDRYWQMFIVLGSRWDLQRGQLCEDAASPCVPFGGLSVDGGHHAGNCIRFLQFCPYKNAWVTFSSTPDSSK